MKVFFDIVRFFDMIQRIMRRGSHKFSKRMRADIHTGMIEIIYNALRNL